MSKDDDTTTVGLVEARQVCRDALASLGTPHATAKQIVHALIDNERRGHSSHGLLRIFDYVEDVEAGRIDPNAHPTVDILSPAARVVDGHRCFGALAAAEVARQLAEVAGTAAAGPGLGAVALTNSGHLGRLADIGRPVAAGGAVALGFVNFLGGGQRVAPWGGQHGRLCTNPLLIAVPTTPEPFVLDMSTSTVAEGKIRQRWLVGSDVPIGWLTTVDGKPTRDPAGLYRDPPSAVMTPLGGDQGHKGYGLGLAVEILAGVLTGAGFVRSTPADGGNGGLFIGFTPTLLGRTAAQIRSDLYELRAHITAAGGGNVRWPGEGHTHVPSPGTPLTLPTSLWAGIRQTAEATRKRL